jgi:two-component system, OmpR family, response regulator
MARRIAIVEDEVAIRENYASVLKRQNYEVSQYGSRQEAMTAFKNQLPELVIVDIALEDEADGGLELCRELRMMSSNLPIMFLTARDSEIDVVSGLRLGADDYLTKDISTPHLLARIAALFRRVDALNTPPLAESMVQRGFLTLDTQRLTASWRGTPVRLTLTEFWIIHALARYPGHVKNREQLMKEANVLVDDSTITSHIKRIRKKFLQIDDDFAAIDTVYGMGYRWRDESPHLIHAQQHAQA